MLRRNVWFRVLIILLVIAVTLHIAALLWDLAQRFGDVIMLFALAWIFAFVLRPIARILHRRLLVPWPASVAVVYFVFFAYVLVLGAVLIPVLVAQVSELALKVPIWAQTVPAWYESVQGYLPEQLQVENLPALFGQRDFVAPLQQLATTLLQNLLGLLTGLATGLFALVIVLILSFYLTLDGDRISRGIVRLVPENLQDTFHFFINSTERSFGGFLRGQLLQAVIYASGTAIIMMVAGVGYVVLATFIAAIAMVIPFVGPFIAIIPPIFLAALQGPLSTVIGVTVALFVLQQVVFNVIAPKVMSDAVGIHPLLVFAAILIGSKVAGIAGAIFGVPVAAVLAAMAGFLYNRARPDLSTAGAPAGLDPEPGPKEASQPGHGFWHWVGTRVLGRRASQ
jgi:predicted PurR-regulated permease PerM